MPQSSSDPVATVQQIRQTGNIKPLIQLIDTSTLQVDELLHLACVDLLVLAQNGFSVSVEQYISMFPAIADHTDGVMDLIDAEVCARRQWGKPPNEQEYLDRFPNYQTRISKLFAFDAAAPTVRDEIEEPESIDSGSDRLGGYQLLEVVGKGAMGVVYRARQISLNREVAVKVVRGKWSGNPVVMARFVREAYAAAQLSHPNVVRIYDFGMDRGQYFFSMEWIQAGTLSEYVHGHQTIRPLEAARYILQAARGLRFAHAHGMVHRDIKPANLLIDHEGIVKVADLGLVKIPEIEDGALEDSPSGEESGLHRWLSSGSNVTGFGNAVGTPNYMAPEQTIDAGTVDHRADIYSLGRTFQFVLTHGRSEANSSPDDTIPEPITTVLRRATARRPEDRYANIDAMIGDLERIVGIGSAEGCQPTVDEIGRITQCAQRWRDLSGYRRGSAVLAGAIALTLAAIGLSVLTSISWGVFWIAMLVSAVPTLIITDHLLEPSETSRVVREILVRTPLSRWFQGLLCGIFVVIALVQFHLAGWAIGGLLVGGALAAVIGYLWFRQRAGRLVQLRPLADELLSSLRSRGLSEQQIHQWLIDHGGRHAGSFAIFLLGIEAVSESRTGRGLLHDREVKSGLEAVRADVTVSDEIKLRLQRLAHSMRRHDDRRALVAIESQSLRSQGLSRSEASHQAWQTATILMQASRELERSKDDQRQAAEARRLRMKAMMAEARSGQYDSDRPRPNPIAMFVGQEARLLASAVLIAVAALFAVQMDTPSGISSDRGTADMWWQMSRTTFHIGQVPLNVLCLGWAGFLLLLTSFVQGAKISFFVVPAAIILVLAPSMAFLVANNIDPSMTCGLIATGLTAAGLMFGRSQQRLDMF